MALFAAVMALLPAPPETPIDSLGDKWKHALAFAALTLVAQFAWGRGARWRVAERLSFFGAMIEVAQSIPMFHRDCDVVDWLVDTAVVVIVTIGFLIADARWRRQELAAI